MKYIGMIILVTLLAGAMESQAQMQALRDRIPGGGGGTAAEVNLDALSADLDKSILEVGIARKLLIKAQMVLAEALGIKEEADSIVSAAGVLGEGGVVTQPTTAKDIEHSIEVSEQLNERLNAAAAEAGELSEEGKIKLAEGKKLFADGLVAEAMQVAVLTRLATEFDGARGQVRRNPARLRQLTALFVPTAKLASLIPGDVRAMHHTWGLIQKVGQNNQIDSEDIDIDALLAGAQ